jgi:hypothetical protein
MRDLNEDLLLKELNNDSFNAIKWCKENYDKTDSADDFEKCIVKEKIKLINDCIVNNIPLHIKLKKEFKINCNDNIESIFNIKNKETNKNWIEIFKKDINRYIKVIETKDLYKYLLKHKKLFIKSIDKGFSIKFSLDEVDYYLLKSFKSYSLHSYILEDLNLLNKPIEIIKKKLGKDYYKIALQTIIKYFKHDAYKIIISEIKNFNYKNEFRCIFVGNKIHSISERIDYTEFSIHNKQSYKIIENYCNYLKDKYYKKVPNKIWNVDICLVKNKPHIIEAHLDCNRLGHFLYNQDYLKYFQLLNEKI